MENVQPIVYYVTAHGYGHGVRTADIVRACAEAHPHWHWILVTDLPASFIQARYHGINYTLRAGSFDVGMVQLDSIRVDVDATLQRLQELEQQRRHHLIQEKHFLEEVGAAMVLADVPSLPLRAARELGIPALAVANFTWDWIYEPFVDRDPAWIQQVEMFREEYGMADLAFKMPFSPELNCFPQQESMPLVARPGRNRREELAELTGADPDKTWVLLSFTTLDWTPEALKRIEQIQDHALLTVMPLAWQGEPFHQIDRKRMPFIDALASCDVVLTKPGYGIVSECIVTHKPVIYADRADFAEYACLVDGIQRFLKHVHLPSEKLYAGELEEAFAAIQKAPEPPETLGTGGGQRIAERLLDFYDG